MRPERKTAVTSYSCTLLQTESLPTWMPLMLTAYLSSQVMRSRAFAGTLSRLKLFRNQRSAAICSFGYQIKCADGVKSRASVALSLPRIVETTK